jgi:RimJ/RimL family protein N-acetyltransferase
MEQDLTGWCGCREPERTVFDGCYVRLEPLSATEHGDGLYAAETAAGSAERFRWLPDFPPQNRQGFQPWLDHAETSNDPLYFTAIDKGSGKIGGRQSFLRIDTGNGVIEIGHIFWSALIARRPAASEAIYLFARYVFDDLGYRRFEWKCDSRNEASRRAAIRFGFQFEGIFRQAAVVKGAIRDTAWYAMIDREWPAVKRAFENWLVPENFGPGGQQIRRLSEIRKIDA